MATSLDDVVGLQRAMHRVSARLEAGEQITWSDGDAALLKAAGLAWRNAAEYFTKLLALERMRKRAAIENFIRVVGSGDIESLAPAMGALQHLGVWPRAFRACSRLPKIPAATRRAFLRFWVENGDSLRCDVTDDLTLITGLRLLLPPYKGRPVLLFRGESAFNRKRRTYGMSWTSKRDVAEAFAKGGARELYRSGTVLLETIAPAEAIIGKPLRHKWSVAGYEHEYIVDRCQLTAVTVLKRFPYEPQFHSNGSDDEQSAAHHH